MLKLFKGESTKNVEEMLASPSTNHTRKEFQQIKTSKTSRKLSKRFFSKMSFYYFFYLTNCATNLVLFY
jgi:hypothetical protein